MKNLKKLASLLLALVMVLAMSVPAMAAEGDPTYSITISNPAASDTYNAYKIFDVTYEVGTDGTNTGKYSYTIAANSDWLSDVKSYTVATKGDSGAWTIGTLNENAGVIEGNGLKLTLSADKSCYVVETKTGTFSAANFAEYLATKTAGKTANGTGTTVNVDTPVVIGLDGANNGAGYYLVTCKGKTETDGVHTTALAELNTAAPQVTITDKNVGPTIDKTIVTQEADATATPAKSKKTADYNNAAIGDTVNYEVTSKVPDMTGYTKYYFVVNDTMSKGLTFNNDVQITIGTKELTMDVAAGQDGSDAQTKDYAVTVTNNADGTTGIEIVFHNFKQYDTEDYVDQTITITYSATVNTNAVIGVTGNPNTVTLTYSNDPNKTGTGEDKPDETDTDVTGKTPASTTYTYVTGLEIDKVDKDTKERLAGATFKLEGTALNTVLVETETFVVDETNGTYWELNDGSYTTTDPSTSGVDTSKYADTTTKYIKTVVNTTITKTENVSYKGTTGADGVLIFNGLPAGEYVLTELVAPNGFNLLQNPITVIIGWTAPTVAATDCSWSYTFYNGTGDSKTSINGPIGNVVAVENQAGSLLPSTGGMGTTVFYVVGGILVFGAAVLLITKRRMNSSR